MDDHKLYIGTQKAAWKANVFHATPMFRSPFRWRAQRLPAVDQNSSSDDHLSGVAKVFENSAVKADVLKLYHDVVKDEKALAESCVIEVIPQEDFITYGVGIPLLQMHFQRRRTVAQRLQRHKLALKHFLPRLTIAHSQAEPIPKPTHKAR